MLVQNVFTSTLINKKAAGRGMSTKVKKEAKPVCVTTCILSIANTALTNPGLEGELAGNGRRKRNGCCQILPCTAGDMQLLVSL